MKVVMKVSVIIPALNEEGTIRRTVTVAKRAFPEGEIIVSDSGSKDATRSIAALAGARVVKAARGKGNAMARGADESCGRVIVFFDADITDVSARMLKRLAKPVIEGECGVSIGSYVSPYPQTFTETVYRPFVKLLFPEVNAAIPQSPLSGQRAMLKCVWSRMDVARDFGVETSMNIDLVLKNVPIRTVHLGTIHPISKGVLGRKALMTRAEEIANALISKARQYGRLNIIEESHFRTVCEGMVSALRREIPAQ